MPSTRSALSSLTIRGPWVSSHVLFDPVAREVVLIDGGFPRDAVARITTALGRQGFALPEVAAILLTHGHLDHTLNIARLKEISGAPVFAHPADSQFIAGKAARRGFSRCGGALETIGRRCLRYRPPTIDHWLEDGLVLPFWGGLRVVHLPGHTPGHCGFYSEASRLLFAGDLFANFVGNVQVPPRIFSFDRNQAVQSILNASRWLPPDAGVVLNHGRDADPGSNRTDLDRLARKLSPKAGH